MREQGNGVFTGGAIFAAIRWFERRVRNPWVRALLLITVAWVPLALLSVLGGGLCGDQMTVPLLKDYATYARFWIALPILVLARPLMGYWVHAVVEYVERNALILPAQQEAFIYIWKRFLRLTNSTLIDLPLILIALVLLAGQLPFRVPADAVGWNFCRLHGRLIITPAGYWFLLVSSLLFATLVLKWGWVYLQWIGFLFRFARLPLNLIMIHPDRRGGLGVVPLGHAVFALPVVAIGTVLLGILMNGILYFHYTQRHIGMMALVYAGAMLIILAAPLLIFTPRLIMLRRHGLLQFGTFAGRYVRDFVTRWQVPSMAPTDESPLGTADIQSLADLDNSYTIVTTIHTTLIGLQFLLLLLVAILLPLIPLLFLLLPMQTIVTIAVEIAKRVL